MYIKNLMRYASFLEKNNDYESYKDSVRSIGMKAAESSHEGFNNKEEATDYVNWVVDNLVGMPNSEVKLLRVLSVESEEDIDAEEIGEHFIFYSDKNRLNDRGFYDSIGLDLNDDNRLFVVTLITKYSNIDWNVTFSNNLNFPNEFEVNLIDKPKILKIEELNKNEITY